jgi:methylated-DNA-protein-cysteine methyltransferase-like protein
LVGRVLGQLPEDHDIPWYRVVNSQGRISLKKLDEKGMCIQTAKLLAEDVVVIDGKINLKKYQWAP